MQHMNSQIGEKDAIIQSLEKQLSEARSELVEAQTKKEIATRDSREKSEKFEVTDRELNHNKKRLDEEVEKGKQQSHEITKMSLMASEERVNLQTKYVGSSNTHIAYSNCTLVHKGSVLLSFL